MVVLYIFPFLCYNLDFGTPVSFLGDCKEVVVGIIVGAVLGEWTGVLLYDDGRGKGIF